MVDNVRLNRNTNTDMEKVQDLFVFISSKVFLNNSQHVSQSSLSLKERPCAFTQA